MNNYIIITPKDWGPLFWNFLHCIPNSLNNENKCNFIVLFKKLSYVLPCPECKIHYCEFINKNKLDFKNITILKMKKWILDLHNSVNLKLGKKKYSLKESNRIHKNINDSKFLTLVNYIIKGAMQNKISVYKFLNFILFFEIISNIYPNEKIRNKFKDIEKLEISNIEELDKWFMNCLKYKKVYLQY